MAGMMGLMQFQREMENREIPKQTAYMLGQAYEAIFEMSKQMDTMSDLILKMAETMENVVGSNELVLRQAQQLNKMGKEDGIDVRSVLNDPEDRDN